MFCQVCHVREAMVRVSATDASPETVRCYPCSRASSGDATPIVEPSEFRAELDSLETRIYTIETGSPEWHRVRELRALDAATRVEYIDADDVPEGSFVPFQLAKDGDRVWRQALDEGSFLVGSFCGGESRDVLAFDAICGDISRACEWAIAVAGLGSKKRAFIVAK